MSSPPGPPPPAGGSPPSDASGAVPEARIEMSFFVPFPGGSPGDGEAPPSAEGGSGGGEAGPGPAHQPGGMVWTFHLQPERAASPPVAGPSAGGSSHPPAASSSASPQPSSSARPTPPSGQRLSGGLPFSGPLNPPTHPLSFSSLPPPLPLSPHLAALFPRASGQAGSSAGPPGPSGGAAAPGGAGNPGPFASSMVFMVRPDGSVGHMPPHGAPAPGHPGTGPAGPAGAIFAMPPQGFMFPFHLAGAFGGGAPAPDPEKAKELLTSLPEVEKGLMKRVDRIYAAENVEEGAWKCGVCLEGWESSSEDGDVSAGKKDAEADEGTGVKRLPCNHLFHGECLQPWFETKHTCPSCRLDLDPGRTLRPSTGGSSLRARTFALGGREARQNQQHPYRPPTGAAAASGSAAAESAPDEPPAQRASGMSAEEENHWTTTVNMFVDMAADAAHGALGDALAAGGLQPILGDEHLTGEPSPFPSAEASPVPRFASFGRRTGIMPRIQSPAGGSSASSAPTPASDPHHHHHHHHVHHHHLPQHVPPPHFHVHRHGPIPAGPSAAAPAASSTDSAQRTHHTDSAFIPTSFPVPTPDRQNPPAAGPDASAILEGFTQTFNENPFTFLFPVGGGGPAAPPSRTAPSTAAPPVKQIPLEKWVQNHERALGWCCDSAACGIAPTNEEGDAFAQMAVKDRPRVRDLIGVRGCKHAYHAPCIPGAVSVVPEEDGGEVAEDEVRVRCGECEQVGTMFRWDAEGWDEEDIVEVTC